MHRIIKYRKYFLVFITIFTCVFTYGLKDLYVSFSFESFYPKTNPEYTFYHDYRNTFLADDDLMESIALISPKGDIFDKDFLQKADSTFAQIGRLQGIDSMISGTRFSYIKRSGLGFKEIPYLVFENEEDIALSRENVTRDSAMFGTFITRDKKALCGHFVIDSTISDNWKRDILNQKVDSILAKSNLKFIASGVPYIRSQYVSKIESEVKLFVIIAAVLLAVMLTLTFRNWVFVVLPIGTVMIGAIWTYGLMAMTGQAINIVTNLLIPIVFVVGVSDIIHISTKYLAELKSGKDRQTAMLSTLEEIGFATLLTCITTAVGFLSLAVTDVSPLYYFGLYGSFGVVGTYLVSITLIPNILMNIPEKWILGTKSIESSEKWTPLLLFFHKISTGKPRLIITIFSIILVVATYFTTQIPMNMHLLEDLSWRDPVRESMIFFEKNLFGVRPFELGITAKGDKKVSDREILLEIEKIQNWLDKNTDFQLFISPVTFVKGANYVAHFNRDSARVIPATQGEIDELLDFAAAKNGDVLLKRVMTSDRKMARLGARSPDLGADFHKGIRDSLTAYIQQNCDTKLFDYHFTGHGFLTENNLKYIRDGILQGLLIDFLTIGLIMGLMYKSFRMMLLSMIPNIIPLVVTAGVMGIFDITLTTSAAVVFVVIFGIAVDDTIHFMTHYKIELKKGLLPEEALKETMLGTGKAMILTSIVLLSGFFTLLTSTFGGTFTIGLFSLITIIFAVFSDLFLAPLLLKYFGPKE